ncbi:double-cubane-cluster-containing anaerobic reductase [Paradesulfitobacterium aromaticivorans]
MTEYEQMWDKLGVDLDKHDRLLRGLAVLVRKHHKKQSNRPVNMDYFDSVLADPHGHRVKELVEHRRQGGIVVGSYCVFIPEELVLAVDGQHVGLCAGSNFAEQDAEYYLPRNTCPLIKASFGYKVSKACPYTQVSDLIVGETTCDGKKKMFEELVNHHHVYLIEVPQKKNERSKEFFTGEFLEFKKYLENVSGQKITSEKLQQSIMLVEGKFKALQRLFNCRMADPAPLSGLDALTVVQLGMQDEVKRFTEKVNFLCDELEKRIAEGVGVTQKGALRVLIAGSPMSFPNWRLHNIIERYGAVVVCEESCIGTRLFSNLCNGQGEAVEDKIRSLAHRHLGINCACFTPNQERVEDIIRLAREYQVDGVIHYALQFCHPYNNEAGKIKRALKQVNIPLLEIQTDYGDGDGQLGLRVEAFLDLLKEKRSEQNE